MPSLGFEAYEPAGDGFRLAQAGDDGHPARRKNAGWRVCPGRFAGPEKMAITRKAPVIHQREGWSKAGPFPRTCEVLNR